MRRDHIGMRAGVLLLLAIILGGCNGAPASTVAPPSPTTAPLPVRVVSPTETAAVMTRADVPAMVYDTLHYIQTHNGDPPPGYVGGTVFDNRERRLPEGRYKEYDVSPKVPGMSRSALRLVINQDTGQAYYTADHYLTFVPVSPALTAGIALRQRERSCIRGNRKSRAILTNLNSRIDFLNEMRYPASGSGAVKHDVRAAHYRQARDCHGTTAHFSGRIWSNR